jgi:hypothetical protein
MAVDFSKKIGGVPVIYLAGGGAVILVIVAWKMKTVATPTEEEVGEEVGEDVGEVTTTAPSGTAVDYSGLATGGATSYAVYEPEPVETTVETNETWGKAAVTYLSEQGYSTLSAQRAIANYLAGADLSYDESMAVEKATKKLGVPPEAVTPGKTGSEPAKKQGTLPRVHVVKGVNDNTVAKLATLYYARKDDVATDLLEAANIAIGKGPWGTGQKVTVPKWRSAKYVTARRGMTMLRDIARKNGTTQAKVRELNDELKFPVKVGTRVRVA